MSRNNYLNPCDVAGIHGIKYYKSLDDQHAYMLKVDYDDHTVMMWHDTDVFGKTVNFKPYLSSLSSMILGSIRDYYREMSTKEVFVELL